MGPAKSIFWPVWQTHAGSSSQVDDASVYPRTPPLNEPWPGLDPLKQASASWHRIAVSHLQNLTRSLEIDEGSVECLPASGPAVSLVASASAAAVGAIACVPVPAAGQLCMTWLEASPADPPLLHEPSGAASAAPAAVAAVEIEHLLSRARACLQRRSWSNDCSVCSAAPLLQAISTANARSGPPAFRTSSQLRFALASYPHPTGNPPYFPLVTADPHRVSTTFIASGSSSDRLER
ncbi:hypothetical protein PaG_00794 [Moesziomyces aphidis]|uniref:Uncharacterized protein n=1 Tax=Moesziomyces aphidis TaxID=84754 RepID=W3VVN9_MOEAP|nr:hypothetical protein PaG_00794 [Moesziomyces aphidis]